MSTIARTLSLALLAPAALAGDLIVGPAGSGAPYTDIQTAIRAADGIDDRVLVRPGAYVGSIEITKSVDLIGIGYGSHWIVPTADPSGSGPAPHFTVRDITADARVTIVGFATAAPAAPLGNYAGHAAVIESCEGAVTLADMRLGSEGTSIDATIREAVRIENCGAVVLDGCDISAYDQPAGHDQDEGQAGLRAVDSFVSINDCSIAGGLGAISAELQGGSGGPGVVAVGSSIDAAGLLANGSVGAGTSIFAPGLTGGVGGAAVRAESGSFVRLAGGDTTRLYGGAGEAAGADPSDLGAGGPAIDVRTGSAVEPSIGTFFTGGTDASGTVIAPGIVYDDSPGGVPGISFYRPGLNASTKRPGLGDTLQLELRGAAPRSAVAILSADRLRPTVSLQFQDLALLDRARATRVALLVTDGSGAANLELTFPAGVQLGQELYFQAGVVEPAEPVSLSPATYAIVSE